MMSSAHPFSLEAARSARLLILSIGIVVLTLAPAAEGSTYGVHQCTSQQPSADDARLEGAAPGYIPFNSCASINRLQVGSSAAVGPGQNRAYSFTAPDGTRIDRVTADYLLQGRDDAGGHVSYMFIRPVGDPERTVLVHGGAGSTSGSYNSALQDGPIERFGIGMSCTRNASQGNCPARSGIYVRTGNIGLSMQDTVAPGTPQTTGPALSGWHGSPTTLSYNVADTGAGVHVGGTIVNETGVDLKIYCAPETAPSGAVKRMKPCPGTASASTALDVTAPPFSQGANAVRTCVAEYGTGTQQQTCKSDTVRVDTVAPTAPNSLAVAGGEGWKRDNGFSLSWSNPTQAHAPIVGARVRLTGPRGYDQSQWYPGNDRDSIENLTVPAIGDYTAEVYLQDAAGNRTEANASDAHLRFDDTVPVKSDPAIANGWISRSELRAGYLQRWRAPTADQTPPSGIAGYRVVVNTNSDTDPCSGAADPRACGGPVTELGLANTSRLLESDDLVEGTNYVHVAPVSGSGMRATDVGHTPLEVDLTDPSTILRGDGNGEWLNRDASLQAVATDALSGMADTDEFPDDAPPATFLEADGQLIDLPDSQVGTTIGREGVHQVRFWARDVAGNTAQAEARTVMIDKSAPELAFTTSQDPDDPDELTAAVSDGLSGVVDGRISYREAGGAAWKGLETALRDGELVARVDSGDLRPGVTYEFRATATDGAGNSRTSTRKANGEPMQVIGPFRAITGVVDLNVNGRPRAKVGYGKRANVSGVLLTDEGGRPVAGAAVEIIETFGHGSRQLTRAATVLTDNAGGFARKLGKGPSRTIVASFGGDRRYLGTSSAQARLGVRSKITLKAPPTAREGEKTAFKGRIKAKGADLGRAGKRLEIQVRIGRKWKAVGRSIRTNRRGSYKLTYRFTASYTEPVRYEFRAVVLRERSFPYLASKSKGRSVVVSP